MLDSLFIREDVKSLINLIYTSNKYNKNVMGSPLKKDFLDIKDSLFFVYESLYKYKVIIESEEFLDDYVFFLNKCLNKLSDYNDMINGVNRLIARYLYKKLGLEENDSNKKSILNYVYYKYIKCGYLFYGCSDKFLSYVSVNGMTSGIYDNSNSEIINIFKEKELNLYKEVCLTDNFIYACFDGYSYPNHLSRLFNNHYTNEFGFDSDVFYRKDFNDCVNVFNRLCRNLGVKKDVDILNKCFCDDWNNYNVSTSTSKVLLIKRSAVGMDNISNIVELIDRCLSDDIEDGIAKIIDYKYNSIPINVVISFNDISVINLLSYKKGNNDDSKIELLDNNTVSDNLVDQYGVANWVLVLLSIFVTLILLGVIILFGGY